MKYRYYIIDTLAFDIIGTDDEALAERESMRDEYLVIDAELGQQVAMDTVGERFDIARAKDED